MSLSKELCLRSDSQNSHSFDDRFCDDLCEDILQYLSLKDKLRFQCVSKQFQRTVFERQYELYISVTAPEEYNEYWVIKDLFVIKRVHNYYYIEDQSLDSFKSLLKKCPNITSIELDGHHYGRREYDHDKINEVFPLIIESCNNLREVIGLNHI